MISHSPGKSTSANVSEVHGCPSVIYHTELQAQYRISCVVCYSVGGLPLVVFHLVGEMSLTLNDDVVIEFNVVFVLVAKLNPEEIVLQITVVVATREWFSLRCFCTFCK